MPGCAVDDQAVLLLRRGIIAARAGLLTCRCLATIWYDFDVDLTLLNQTLPHFYLKILLEILFQFKFFQKQKQIRNLKLRKPDRVRENRCKQMMFLD